MTTNTALRSSPFFEQLQLAISSGTLTKLVLSKYKGPEPLKQLQIRPVELKQQPQLSFIYKYQTNDITRNFARDAALTEIQQLIGEQFFAAHLYTRTAEMQLSVSKKGKALYQHKPLNTSEISAISDVPAEHNRQKHRYISLERPFLTQLGVTDQHQRLIPAMSKKWKQINKFIEILAGAITDTGLVSHKQLHVADFGSGKAYLTFAVHEYLTHTLGLSAHITGVELRQNLVDLCNQVADKLQLTGIHFEQGDVKHYKARGIDVMIALHACDTATDYAIHMGIEAGAHIIMCSPCCHKQIRPQIKMPVQLAPVLAHGIHMAQEAEMVTDSLRALLLNAHGYDTKVFEFISLEHTSKNKMILATKHTQRRDNQQVLQQITELKSFFGIKEHCLEQLLGSR